MFAIDRGMPDMFAVDFMPKELKTTYRSKLSACTCISQFDSALTVREQGAHLGNPSSTLAMVLLEKPNSTHVDLCDLEK